MEEKAGIGRNIFDEYTHSKGKGFKAGHRACRENFVVVYFGCDNNENAILSEGKSFYQYDIGTVGFVFSFRIRRRRFRAEILKTGGVYYCLVHNLPTRVSQDSI